MSSSAQVAANQKNASHSTGPRTDAGKATSSQNAMKSGVTSARVILPFESQKEYNAVYDGFMAQFAPANFIERVIVEEIANAFWRIRRVTAAQESYMTEKLGPYVIPNPLLAIAEIMLSKEMQRLHKYETSYRREYESAWRKLQAIQKARKLKEQQQAEAQPAARKTPAAPPLQNEPNFPAAPAAHDPATADLLARLEAEIRATDASAAS